MNRSKKIVALAHCLLNINAKVDGIATSPAGATELVSLLMQNGFGIIQLPCVEQDMCGIRRWGQVKNQLNHPSFIARCNEMLTPVVNQLEDFYNNGYKICGIIGVDGSPSCGVNLSCSGEWYGEIGEIYNTMEKANTLEMTEESGVMIDVLKKMLSSRKMSIPFFSVNEKNMNGDWQKLIDILNEK